MSGILKSTTVQDTEETEDLKQLVCKAEDALKELMVLIANRKAKKGVLGWLAKLATSPSFEQESKKVQVALHELGQALQLGIGVNVLKKVKATAVHKPAAEHG